MKPYRLCDRAKAVLINEHLPQRVRAYRWYLVPFRYGPVVTVPLPVRVVSIRREVIEPRAGARTCDVKARVEGVVSVSSYGESIRWRAGWDDKHAVGVIWFEGDVW